MPFRPHFWTLDLDIDRSGALKNPLASAGRVAACSSPQCLAHFAHYTLTPTDDLHFLFRINTDMEVVKIPTVISKGAEFREDKCLLL